MLAYKNTWQPVNLLVGRHRSKTFHLFSVRLLNISDFFSPSSLATLTRRAHYGHPLILTDSPFACLPSIHVSITFCDSKQRCPSSITQRLIHRVNGIIGRSMPFEWPWHAAGSHHVRSSDGQTRRTGLFISDSFILMLCHYFSILKPELFSGFCLIYTVLIWNSKISLTFPVFMLN